MVNIDKWLCFLLSIFCCLHHNLHYYNRGFVI
nr:MAG TPA: anti-sigma factor [Siphoviridae sp. ctHdl3]